PQALRQENLCVNLIQASAGVAEVLYKLPRRHTALTLRDVAGNRNSSPTNLTRQAKALIRREHGTLLVHFLDQVHALLPGDQISIGLDLRHENTLPITSRSDGEHSPLATSH